MKLILILGYSLGSIGMTIMALLNVGTDSEFALYTIAALLFQILSNQVLRREE